MRPGGPRRLTGQHWTSQRLCMHFIGAARWCHVVTERLHAAPLALCLLCAVPHPHPVTRRRLPAAGPFVVLPSHWSLLRWVLPTSCQLSASVFNLLVEWWSSGGEWGKRRTPAFSPSSLPRLGPASELRGTGNRLRALSPRPPTGWAQALRQWRSSPPSLSLPPNSSGLRRTQSAWVLSTWLPPWWQLARAWGPGPEGTASWDLPALSQDLDLGGWKLSLGTLPFHVRTENDIHLVEIYRNIITWPWPDHRNKGSDSKKFAITNLTTPLLHLFYKRALLKALGEFGVFKACVTRFPSWPCSKPLSVPNFIVLILFGLTARWAQKLVFWWQYQVTLPW